MSKKLEHYQKYACGIFIVRADNANFNADFDGMPRELPTGKIYATDKALKYCIRKYIHDVKGEDQVFAWRRFKNGEDTAEVQTLEENIEYLFKKSTEETKEKKAEQLTQKEIVKLALSKVDVRLFGATLAISQKNVSINGTCQITYGVDMFNKKVTTYTSSILSPYASDKDKEKSTIGAESRALEVHYVYDFTINPNNLSKDEQIKSLLGGEADNYYLQTEDVKLFKEAITRGVNYVTSTTKVGAVGELLLFIEFEKDQQENIPLVPLLKTKVNISENGAKRQINLNDVIQSIKAYSPKYIEIYYDPEYTDIICDNPEVKHFHIGTHSEIKGKL